MSPIYELLFYLLLLPIITVASRICSRHDSRSAREVISELFHSHYIEQNVAVPDACPFQVRRDMYNANEEHKTKESLSRWSCEYCGKAFITEASLDKHFDNRHADTVFKGSAAVCMADYCDFLRCAVVSGVHKPTYWDKALCKETDIAVLREKCESMVKTCAPTTLVGTARYDFQRNVRDSLCSYLTCDKFWEVLLKDGSTFGMTAYVFAVIILFTLLIIYYFIVYTHYYSEHSLLDDSDGLLKMRRQTAYYPRDPSSHEIRQRIVDR